MKILARFPIQVEAQQGPSQDQRAKQQQQENSWPRPDDNGHPSAPPSQHLQPPQHPQHPLQPNGRNEEELKSNQDQEEVLQNLIKHGFKRQQASEMLLNLYKQQAAQKK